MTSTELLVDLRRRGLALTPEGVHLRVAPKSRLTPALREAIAASRDELLALLLAEAPQVAWRIEAMQEQPPPAGPIPFLVARDTLVRSGACLSCGDLLAEGQTYRCPPCVQAATVVVGRHSGSAASKKGGQT